jgi:hypothetical protein
MKADGVKAEAEAMKKAAATAENFMVYLSTSLKE